MMTVQEAFETFKSRLELTQTEQDDAARRQKDVRTCIKGSFDVERDFLTGSYGRRTKTKPLKDVDIFFVLGSDEDHRRQKAPGQLIDAFETCLVDCYGRDQVKRGRRCVTVFFEKRNQTQHEDGKVLSIDAVPAFDASTHYEIPDDVLGEWIKSDPEIHKEKATARNAELQGKWVPLVKMLKSWNRANGKPIKPSFLVEVMAIDLVDAPCNNYPDEVRRFFAAAAESVHSDWPDPAGLGPPVSDQMDQERRHTASTALRAAERAAARAFRAEAVGSQGEALRIWKGIFGQYFPSA